MKRREFITLVGGVAGALSLSWPYAVHAQRQQKRRVAVLMGGLFSGDPGGQAEASALEDGLGELGWKLGGNIELEYYWPGAELDSVHAAVNEIKAARPDLVVSRTTPATAAMKDSGLPVVFALVSDPLGSGIVQNLGQPGGNLTGFSVYEGSVGGKWLALLKEAVPSVSRVSLLFNPPTAPFAENYLRTAQAAAQTLGVTVISAPCNSPADIEAAFAVRAREGNGGIIGDADTFIGQHRDLIIGLAARNRLPAVYGIRDFVPSGGLMAYAADFPELFRRTAGYVDRILRGARPGELPVQAPEKFALSINLKAAGAIGLTLPQTLIARADEVVE
jgi:putative tryptophan/tyrosine transport system substrate-binding protein